VDGGVVGDFVEGDGGVLDDYAHCVGDMGAPDPGVGGDLT
jgi:hypothetical protein